MLPVKYTTKAERYFKKIRDKALKKKFSDAINVLREYPMAGEMKKHDLAGIMGYDVFHNKVNYEIAYTVIEVDGETLLIILAGTRENIYEELKKYLKE